MNRRLLAGAALAVVALLAATSWPAGPTPRHVAFVVPAPADKEQVDGFTRALANEGFGAQDVVLSVHAAGPTADAAARVVRAAVAAKPDVICVTGRSQILAVARMTDSIPVVFFNADDPVRAGIVKSQRSPGGNVTGIASRITELHVKRLEIFKALRPGARTIAMLVPADVRGTSSVRNFREVLQRMGLGGVEIAGPEKMDRAGLVAALQAARADAFISIGFELASEHWPEIQRAAGIPGLFQHPDIARHGGLLSHGPNMKEMEARAAAIAAKVLRGQSTASIHVEELARPYVVVNLKTARALKIDVPPSVRLIADELIE